MRKTLLDVHYFTVLYAILLIQDKAHSSWSLKPLLMDFEYTKLPNYKFKLPLQLEDLSCTKCSEEEHFLSVINKGRNMQWSFSRNVPGELLSLALYGPLKEVNTRLTRPTFGLTFSVPAILGTFNTPYTPEFCHSVGGEVATPFTSSNGNLWKTFVRFLIMIASLVILLLVFLRWKTFSRKKRKVKSGEKISRRTVFSSLSTNGTLFVLSLLSDTVSSSSIASIMATSVNETTFNTSLTSATHPEDSNVMPSPQSSSFGVRPTYSTQSSTFLRSTGNVEAASSSFHEISESPVVVTSMSKSSMTLGNSNASYQSRNFISSPALFTEMQTHFLTTSTFISYTVLLDNPNNKSSSSLYASHLARKTGSANIQHSSVVNESTTLVSISMQSSKFQTRVSSSLQGANAVAVTQSHSKSMALRTNEVLSVFSSVVAYLMSDSAHGSLSASELTSSVPTLMTETSKISSSEFQTDTQTVYSSEGLTTSTRFSSLSLSVLSSSLLLSSRISQFLLSGLSSGSSSTATSPSASSSSVQSHSIGTILVNRVASTLSLNSSSSTGRSHSHLTQLLLPTASLHDSSRLSFTVFSKPPLLSSSSPSSALSPSLTPRPSSPMSSLESISSLKSSSSALLPPTSLPSSSDSSSRTSLLSQTTSSAPLSSPLSLLSSSPPTPPPPPPSLSYSSSSFPSHSLTHRSSLLLRQLSTPSLLATNRPSLSPMSSVNTIALTTSNLPATLSVVLSSSAISVLLSISSLPAPSRSLLQTSLISQTTSSPSRSPLGLLSSSPPTLPPPPPPPSLASSPSSYPSELLTHQSSPLLPQLPTPSPLATNKSSLSSMSSVNVTTSTPSELSVTLSMVLSSSAISVLRSISSLPSSSRSSSQTSLFSHMVLSSSTISINASLLPLTVQVSLLDSSGTVNFTTQATPQLGSITHSEISPQTLISSVLYSVAHINPSAPEEMRKIKLNFSVLNEDFHIDLSNETSVRYMNLSYRVNFTLWEIFNPTVEGLEDIEILQFSNGSVKVDSELVVRNSSNVTSQQVKQTLVARNGTNTEGLTFSRIVAKEICTPVFCLNSGSCVNSDNGASCSCRSAFEGSRCEHKKVDAVNGNYTEWSDFTECSKTCEGGQKSRSRTCTNPPPTNSGRDCKELGRDVEYVDCNGDVRCPISAEIWIAIGVSCGVFLLLLILTIVCILRRRRKQAEQRNGTNDFYSNGHGTMIPLEVIYEDKTVPNVFPKGYANPEFIGDGEDDNDIYKAQLLLFLKQSHLIRPNVYPDEQDNKSETLENARKMSAAFAVSDKNQEDKNKATGVTRVPNVEPSSNSKAIQGENALPTTEL